MGPEQDALVWAVCVALQCSCIAMSVCRVCPRGLLVYTDAANCWAVKVDPEASRGLYSPRANL
eukprot:8631341-Lingulodinium_polyedra.AAC.1